MTFLTIVGVTEILCSFRLVLEGKTGKGIPESSRSEFLGKFYANNFVLSDVEENNSWLLNRGSIAELPEIPESQVSGNWWTLALQEYASLAASKILLQHLLASLKFTLDSEDLLCWYKRKKWFLWIMAAAQAAENHGDEWGLTWCLWWGIYTSIPTWTNSQNSLAAAEALMLKISFQGTSLKWSQRLSQSAQE